MHRKGEKCIEIFGREKPLGRLSHRWEDNLKILRKLGVGVWP